MLEWMDRAFTKRDFLLLAGLTVAALLLRFINLSHPAEIVFDETYFANFANNYLTNTKFFDAEPPLAKFLIAGGIELFGFNPFGWRFTTALFGAGVIPLMYVLAKRLFGGTVIPLCAGLLALFDGLLLVESRVAVIDVYVVFFNLLTYILFLAHLQAKTHRRSFIYLALTGVALGLGLSVKWITLAFIGPAIVLLLLLSQAKRKRFQKLFKLRSRKALFQAIGATRTKLHHPLLYLMLLGVIPAALYLAIFSIHVPFDSTGESIWGIHKQIFNYHHNLKATHPYGSDFYTWPLSLRPVAYYFKAGPQWQTIIALGNPLIWWAGLIAIAGAFWHFFKYRGLAVGLVLFAIIAHYGPWGLIGRVLFIYHYMGALPFVILLIAFFLGRSWIWKPRDASLQLALWVGLLTAGGIMGGLLLRSLLGTKPEVAVFASGAALTMLPMVGFALTEVRKLTWGQKQVIAAMAVFGLAFLYFLPIWTGIGLSPQDYYRRIWLRSWI